MQYKIFDLAGNHLLEDQEPELNISLSFKPFLDFLRRRLNTRDTVKKEIYQVILDKFSAFPELEGEIAPQDMEQYKPLLDLMYMALTPVTAEEGSTYWGLSTPLSPIVFYGSAKFFNLIEQAAAGEMLPGSCDDDVAARIRKKHHMIYSFILQKFYNASKHHKVEILKSLVDEETGLNRHFRINVDTSFIEVTHEGPLPELKIELFPLEFEERNDTSVLQEILPLSKFKFSGVSVITITDITSEHALSTIADAVINNENADCHFEFSIIEKNLQTMAGSNQIRFGLMPLIRINDKKIPNMEAYSNSILFALSRKKQLPPDFLEPFIEEFIEHPRLLYYRDLQQNNISEHKFTSLFAGSDIKSYLLAPLYYNKKLIGAFELYSIENTLLDEQIISRLEPAVPLLTQLVQNTLLDFENEIDKVIKNKFTSLQPAVQWRFNEAAWHYLHRQEQGLDANKEVQIKFEKVYPLYGAIDMRNSTQARNNALREDMIWQVKLLKEILGSLREQNALGLTDEYVYKCSKWLSQLEGHLNANDEIRLNHFLSDDILPFLLHFKGKNPVMTGLIDQYLAAIHPEKGEAWRHRRQLEHSMQLINTSINKYLDGMNEELQKAYPCYFEKLRTDGVEYDIYIGQSITPGTPFDLMYLKNLRLWQLRSMAEIAKLSNSLLPQMETPLQTTQLIFVYTNPIDISFRTDEHRFDVEGGYNIRYHIIKKRIDKVHIKNSTERLTQPGKIALIYFDQKEGEEYLSFINYLQEEGLLNDDLEKLELEELQDVIGLKALRVGVKM
ncbi:GAF domain-containing protein [Niabella insulamsoli]|uniref:GAF domain-containing protein n=1 Tax=Niabella insulamsoli TaxID=3144874 RepID=UPI0031FCA0F7